MSDFLIIGAGINGLLLARELSRAGAQVTLLDSGKTGQESSWAGGGIVSPLYPWRYPPAITALASWAQQFYPQLVAELLTETGIDAQYNRSGLLMLATQECAAALQWAQENNRVMEEVSAARIYRQEPRLRAGFATGLWMPDVANVRNPRLCQALTASLAELPNVTLLEGCRVSGFEHNAGSIESVCVEHSANPGLQRLRASEVIVSAGAWCQQLLAPLGLSVDVAPVKGQMLLYRFPQPPLASIVLTNGRYLIPRADGHLLVGSTLEQVGFDKKITASARTSLQESAVQILAELEHMSPLRQWAGLRPGAPDGLPFIGRLPGFNNLSINAGQYRNGLVLAPASARLLADSLLGRDTIVDPAPYQPATRILG